MEKKVSLKKYVKTIKIITDLCLAADRKYSKSQCQKDLIYKVFKYAYKKNDTSLDKGASSTGSSSSNVPTRISPKASNSVGSINNDYTMHYSSQAYDYEQHPTFAAPYQPYYQSQYQHHIPQNAGNGYPIYMVNNEGSNWNSSQS